MVVCSATKPKMPVFHFIGQQQKTHIFASIFFNEKIIQNPKLYICSKLQAFPFLSTKKISHQSFSGLNNYYSIRAMLENLSFPYF
jgi:hypothetical protein